MIRNLTRQTTVATEVHWARSATERTRGLLDWAEIGDGQALVISPCNSVHMFGMRFSIDVLFVDKGGRVVRAIEGLRPWRLTRIYFRARQTIELPLGAIATSRTTAGDQLDIDE